MLKHFPVVIAMLVPERSVGGFRRTGQKRHEKRVWFTYQRGVPFPGRAIRAVTAHQVDVGGSG